MKNKKSNEKIPQQTDMKIQDPHTVEFHDLFF